MQKEDNRSDDELEVCYRTTRRRTVKTTQVSETTSEVIAGNALSSAPFATSHPCSNVNGLQPYSSSPPSATSSLNTTSSSLDSPPWLRSCHPSVQQATCPQPFSSLHVRPNLPPLILTLRQLDQYSHDHDNDNSYDSPPLHSAQPVVESLTDAGAQAPTSPQAEEQLANFLLPPLATLLSSPTTSSLLTTTTEPWLYPFLQPSVPPSYGHNREERSPDRRNQERRLSSPLPAARNCVLPVVHSSSTTITTTSSSSSSAVQSHNLLWVPETSKDELGKSSVTSSLVMDQQPAGSKSELKRKPGGEMWEVWIQEYSDLPPQKRASFTAEGGKRIPSHMRRNLPCESCGTTETCQWRRGPKGTTTLCNACGLCYARNLARPSTPGKGGGGGGKSKSSPASSSSSRELTSVVTTSEVTGEVMRRHTTSN